MLEYMTLNVTFITIRSTINKKKERMTKTTILCAVLLLPFCVQAQMGIGTLSPDKRSVLELQCTPGKGRGLLIPRMSKLTRRGMELGAGDAGADSVGLALSAVHNGLMLYDNTQNLFYGYEPSMPPVSFPSNYSIAGRDEAKNRVWQILNPWKTQYAWNGDDLLVNLVQDMNSTGFVGIGWVDYTESPTHPLHVKGDGYFDNSNLNVDKTVSAAKVIADTIGKDKVTVFEGLGIVPIGTVVTWSGVWNDAMEAKMKERGWYLCDDKHAKDEDLTYIDLSGEERRIPNLSGRFIVGMDGRDPIAAGGDADYQFVGNTGPNYGEYNGVDQTEFYEIIEGGKRVRLRKPAMPEHNHGHIIKTELPLVQSEKVNNSGCFKLDGDLAKNTLNKMYKYIDDVTGLNAKWIEKKTGDLGERKEYENCGSSFDFEIKFDNYAYNLKNTLDLSTSNNETDYAGGYTYPASSTKSGDKETAIPIENRPPYYVLAYIIRIK